MTKIEKINADIAKTKAKIAEYQGKLRTLEQQKKELENSEIVTAIRSGTVNEHELYAMIRRLKPNDKQKNKEEDNQ